MKRLLLFALLLAPFANEALRAQNFDAANGSAPLLSLDGLWRFHAGDDPAWARPGFDDSGWSLLRSDRDWSTQGYKGYGGMGWYRFHVTLPAGVTDSSILLPELHTCYEVYANGRRIGGLGVMRPSPAPISTYPDQMYAIPRDAISGREVEVALRVWQWSGWVSFSGGGPESGASWIGDTKKIEEQHALAIAQMRWSLASIMILGLLQTLGAVASLLLFLRRRGEREYLWFALILAFGAMAGWLRLSTEFTVWNIPVSNGSIDSLNLALIPLAQMAFYAGLLKTRRSPFYWVAVACLLVSLVHPALMFISGYPLPIYEANAWISVLAMPAYLWILLTVFVKAWRNVADARLLLAPAVLQVTATLLYEIHRVMFFFGLQVANWDAPFSPLRWPFPIQQTQAADLLFLLAVLGILIGRFTRTRSQEESYAREFADAREVQQYLIPAHLPPTPGLMVESEYLPAREVGGDFFQVLPDSTDGSVLVVLGDVAGKGLQAGMLATLIVGAIRVAASFTSDPEKILALLNERLQGRGLVTCLALLIKRGGEAVLANAGHLPPYLNGNEMQMEGALPLGAIPGIEFPLIHFQLAVGDTLMLMSDGVVEAQDADGALFGFERIGQLLREKITAAGLAAAAQSFGQEDDITVLTVARSAAIA